LNYGAIEERIKSLLRDHLANFSSRYGYEPGANYYELAYGGEDASTLQRVFGAERLPAGVVSFFNYFSKFSTPDIGNGYFVGPPSWIVAIYENAEPRGVSDRADRHDLISVGSDGGGKIFAALTFRDSGVYGLPKGRIHNGMYEIRAGKDLASLLIADSFDAFITRLSQFWVAGGWRWQGAAERIGWPGRLWASVQPRHSAGAASGVPVVRRVPPPWPRP
jgi:hypothetical protein